ncbi:NAD(P)H-dependent flavin oxidoreductase [Aspergillus stella-maris]|uniref:NAD(P)H-dependent flavin oxidoreductase n=1 Tax=Aspergillus stella-maris TaxID=1810926 RepID=UPI003CCDB99F
MPFKTWLTETLGIKVPIVQGGMMWVGRAEMTSAVANAGGLGFLTALTQPSPEALRDEIRRCRSMTDKPFGVNITMLPAMNAPDYLAYAKAAVEEGIKIVETAGNPEPILKYLKSNGVIVIHKCVSLGHALKAQAKGVDCISIDGAGHGGEYDTTSMILLGRCAQELKIPFLASGGFCDGKGLAMALVIGAQGINMGTRWMCTVESPIHQNVKAAIVKMDENGTILVLRKFRNTTRLARNEVTLEVHKIENSKLEPQFQEVAHLMSGARGRGVYETGDINAGVWSVGLAAGLIKSIPTCEDLARTIEREAVESLSKASSLYTSRPNL